MRRAELRPSLGAKHRKPLLSWIAGLLLFVGFIGHVQALPSNAAQALFQAADVTMNGQLVDWEVRDLFTAVLSNTTSNSNSTNQATTSASGTQDMLAEHLTISAMAYDMDGDDALTLEEFGGWFDNNNVIGTIDPCPFLPCQHGDCQVVAASADAFCTCYSGYSGTSCDNAIFYPCVDLPCVNGQCLQSADHDPFCNCTDGFTGSLCEYTPCAEDEFMDDSGTCWTLTLCAPFQYEHVAPTPYSDRTCLNITTCGPSEFEQRLPTTTSDRLCVPVTSCPAPLEELAPATPTSDTICGVPGSIGMPALDDRSTDLTSSSTSTSTSTSSMDSDLGSPETWSSTAPSSSTSTQNTCQNSGVLLPGAGVCYCEPPFSGLNCEVESADVETTVTNRRGDVIDLSRIEAPTSDSGMIDPWSTCPDAAVCRRRYGDGICDSQCNSEVCLFDGSDCAVAQACTEAAMCEAAEADGVCQPACMTASCGWDGQDCHLFLLPNLSGRVWTLSLFFAADPEALRTDQTQIQHRLARLLDGIVRIKRIEPSNQASPNLVARGGRRRSSASPQERSAVTFTFQPACTSVCFTDSATAVNFLNSQIASARLDSVFRHRAVLAAEGKQPTNDDTPVWVAAIVGVCVSLACVVLILLGLYAMKGRSEKRKISPTEEHADPDDGSLCSPSVKRRKGMDDGDGNSIMMSPMSSDRPLLASAGASMAWLPDEDNPNHASLLSARNSASLLPLYGLAHSHSPCSPMAKQSTILDAVSIASDDTSLMSFQSTREDAISDVSVDVAMAQQSNQHSTDNATNLLLVPKEVRRSVESVESYFGSDVPSHPSSAHSFNRNLRHLVEDDAICQVVETCVVKVVPFIPSSEPSSMDNGDEDDLFKSAPGATDSGHGTDVASSSANSSAPSSAEMRHKASCPQKICYYASSPGSGSSAASTPNTIHAIAGTPSSATSENSLGTNQSTSDEDVSTAHLRRQKRKVRTHHEVLSASDAQHQFKSDPRGGIVEITYPNLDLWTALVLDSWDDVNPLLAADSSAVHTPNEDGLLPIHFACLNGCKDVVARLLEHGADPYAQDRNEQSALHVAAISNNTDALPALCNHMKELSPVDSHGCTPLITAIKLQHIDFARALLMHGAQPDISDSRGWSPLHWAAALDDRRAVLLLLAARAMINSVSCHGETPLMIACRQGSQAAARTLLEKDASKRVEDNEGRTALDIANANGHVGIASLLEQRLSSDQSNAPQKQQKQLIARSGPGQAKPSRRLPPPTLQAMGRHASPAQAAMSPLSHSP